VLSVFFRNIEVVGEDSFPASGPVIVVANHYNSLIDGVLVTSFLPRISRLLAASSVWDYTPLRPLLSAAGVIRVFRRSEVGVKAARRHGTLSNTWDLLRDGGVLAIFPEGVSHNQPYLKSIKSGAARIALDSEEAYGPLGVTLVPVGLVFDSKARFRSRALVQIGEPITFAPIAQAYPSGDRPARRAMIRELTHKIEAGLQAVTPNFASWEDAHLIGRAADLWDQQDPVVPFKLPLSVTFERRRAFARGYDWMNTHYPEKTQSLRNKLSEYDELLSTAGLRDEQVGASYQAASVLGFAGRTLFSLIIRLPLSAIGTVLNWAPFQLSGLFARGRDRDKKATWSLFSSLILFPLFWLVQAMAYGELATLWLGQPLGGFIFFTVLLASPVTGLVSVKFYDHLRRLLHELRAWFVLKTQKALARQLSETRREVLEQLTEIVSIHEKEAT